MNTEIDSSAIARRIGENIPAVKKEFEEQKLKAKEEKINNDPRLIREKKQKQARIELIEKQDRIFNDSNVVDIFNQLRDQKILMLSNEPTYKEEIIEKSFIEKLLTGVENEIKRTKICDYEPAEVTVSKKEIVYFFDEDKLWLGYHGNGTDINYNLREYIPANHVSIKFNKDKSGESVVFAYVEGEYLIIEGKVKHIVDNEEEDMDLITTIERAIADPYMSYTKVSSSNDDGGWKYDVWDKEPSYTNVKII